MTQDGCLLTRVLMKSSTALAALQACEEADVCLLALMLTARRNGTSPIQLWPHRGAMTTSEMPHRSEDRASDLRLFVVVPAGFEPATFRV
jgi:hypothetical protein